MTEGSLNPLITEDPLTGLPWTETVLPLIMKWAANRTVHAACFHFVGLGILAGHPEFQSSQSVLRTAAKRLTPHLGGGDRVTRYSGNMLLLFSTRPDAEVRQLVDQIREELATLGIDINGQRVPQIRVGTAVLPVGDSPVTMDTLNSLIASAVDETLRAREAGPSLHGPWPSVEEQAPAEEETVDLGFTGSAESIPGEETEPIMVVRGYPDRTLIRQAEGAAPPTPARAEDLSEGRLALREVRVHVTGLVATAIVDLDFKGRPVRGKAIGRSAEKHHLPLVAEAVARAATDLLPPGHGAIFRQAVTAPTDFGDAVVTVVEFLTPDSDEILFGVSAAEGESAEGVARSVLSAINRRTARLLDGSADTE